MERKNQIEFVFCILSLTYNNLLFFHLSFSFLNSSFLCRLKWVSACNSTCQRITGDYTEGIIFFILVYFLRTIFSVQWTLNQVMQMIKGNFISYHGAIDCSVFLLDVKSKGYLIVFCKVFLASMGIKILP